ncbi:hypothetical protein D5F01_LYC16083 [Larimichthys crocea]|uniref:Uncharacterized protein n=2 Tax=Larimichthys crocea TaxID=215358 RepID=A0A6G0I4N7_LARCR|nr:hypothetical protein D5F01_LYC16083 [Larimichthys crocea]
MSNNYPYRPPPSDPDPGPYSSSDRQPALSDSNLYRPPQESFSSSYPSSSSSFSRGAPWSQDSALNILSSCGLEPGDLALLAELPEDVLTVESLPHVLKQIKGKRGTIKPFPPATPSPSSSSYPQSSAHRPAVNTSTGVQDHPHTQLIQYPTDHIQRSLSSDTSCWGNPSSVQADPSPSSSTISSSFHHRPGLSEYGKTGAGPGSSQDFRNRPGPSEYGKTRRGAGPGSSRGRGSFSSAGKDKRTSCFSQLGPDDYKRAPPPDIYHQKTRARRHEPKTSFFESISRPVASVPSKKEALDFHGTCPQVFPYSCSLCDITVMSERVWIKHVNESQHADGQLRLLQQ